MDKITADEAKILARKTNEKYYNVCEAIQIAATDGEQSLKIYGDLSEKIHNVLNTDGFTVDFSEKDNETRIWWGI